MTLAGASVTGLQEDTPPRSAAHLLLHQSWNGPRAYHRGTCPMAC
jgi:hypothetical protein